MGAARPGSMSAMLAGSVELMTAVLAGTHALHWIVGELNGNIRFCNGAVTQSLGLTSNQLLGQPLTSHLVESDAARFPELLANRSRDFKASFLLNFVNSKHEPYTLVCRLDVQPTHFALMGEPAIAEELDLQTELIALNNQLATLARENARKSKELAAANARLENALEELNRSHWHLRKVAEVLPMCVACGKVKSDNAKWEDVAEYFHRNSLWVSHGCCPDCQKTMALE